MSLTNLQIGWWNVLGAGIPIMTMGEIFHVVTAKTGADTYYTRLLAAGVEDEYIFDTLTKAYNACTDNQGDVVCIYPGCHTQTAKITWAKNNTHLIGIGSSNQRIPATAGTTTGTIYLYCVTAMTELLLITGHHCTFANFSTYLSTATGIADIRVQGRNTTLRNIFMKSGQDATQIASAVLGYGLFCDGGAAGYCNGLLVEDCHIGDPRNTVRTDGGMIYMTGVTNAGMCYEFKRCFISGWSETAGVSAVYQTGNWACDRYVLWEDCTFYNFYTNNAALLTAGVFNDTCGTTHMNLLTGKTCMYGWNVWGNNDAYCFGAMPIPDVAGGQMLTMTG